MFATKWWRIVLYRQRILELDQVEHLTERHFRHLTILPLCFKHPSLFWFSPSGEDFFGIGTKGSNKLERFPRQVSSSLACKCLRGMKVINASTYCDSKLFTTIKIFMIKDPGQKEIIWTNEICKFSKNFFVELENVLKRLTEAYSNLVVSIKSVILEF